MSYLRAFRLIFIHDLLSGIYQLKTSLTILNLTQSAVTLALGYYHLKALSQAI